MCFKAFVSIWDFMLALQRLTIEKVECKHKKNTRETKCPCVGYYCSNFIVVLEELPLDLLGWPN